MTCPYCGSTHVTCDEVDNGVGMQQCGPYGCDECHSFQLYDPLMDAETEEEKRVGWKRGEYLDEVLQKRAANET